MKNERLKEKVELKCQRCHSLLTTRKKIPKDVEGWTILDIYNVKCRKCGLVNRFRFNQDGKIVFIKYSPV